MPKMASIKKRSVRILNAGFHNPTANSTSGYLHRNLRLALPAFRAQQDKTQNRNVVVPVNHRATLRAVRARLLNALVQWQPRDAHVQQTAKTAPTRNASISNISGESDQVEYKLLRKVACDQHYTGEFTTAPKKQHFSTQCVFLNTSGTDAV